MRRLFSNFSWLLAGQIGRNLSQLVGISIVARLLTPADFGVVAIALVASNLAGLFRDLGTGPAAIRSTDGSALFLGGIYSVQLAVSVLLAITMLLAAQPLAALYDNTVVERVLVILASVFPITALGAVHLIVLEREQRYREVAALDLAGCIAGVAVAVALASLGVGAESLALQAVAGAAVQVVLLRRVAGNVVRPAHPRHARSAVGGALAVTSFHLTHYFVRNADIGIAGRLASIDFVGAYSMATRVAQMPTQLLGSLVARASVPALASVHTDRQVAARETERLVLVTLLASTLVCLLLSALRQTVTIVLFGAQWREAVPAMLLWLLPAAAFTSTTTAVVGVMTGLGASTSLTRTGVLSLAGHAASLCVCLAFDVSWLPLAMLLSASISLVTAVLHLQALQQQQSMAPLTLRALLPASALLLGFVVCSGSGVGGGMNVDGTRTLGRELLEAVVVSAFVIALGTGHWRRWRKGVLPDARQLSIGAGR